MTTEHSTGSHAANRLRDMLRPTVRRSTDLIVPSVTYKDREGSLNNEDWHFHVPYAFRDALDIRYEERVKKGKKYKVWTQGPFLSFSKGDLLHSRDGKTVLQITFSSPAGWDGAKDEPYEGIVTFDEFDMTDTPEPLVKRGQRSMSQFEFLQLLIEGD